ncbi:MAG TPA: hypothetical protein VLK36_01640 [Gaiellaceae bacterium]|nr:hypothetical protein [Gaiellaceae bacterium]
MGVPVEEIALQVMPAAAALATAAWVVGRTSLDRLRRRRPVRRL